MYLSRKLDEELLKWKVNGQGKPLLISGARQVGTKGSMQSLFLFMEEKKSFFGIRFSLENYSEYGKIKVFPLYAVSDFGSNDQN